MTTNANSVSMYLLLDELEVKIIPYLGLTADEFRVRFLDIPRMEYDRLHHQRRADVSPTTARALIWILAWETDRKETASELFPQKPDAKFIDTIYGYTQDEQDDEINGSGVISDDLYARLRDAVFREYPLMKKCIQFEYNVASMVASDYNDEAFIKLKDRLNFYFPSFCFSYDLYDNYNMTSCVRIRVAELYAQGKIHIPSPEQDNMIKSGYVDPDSCHSIGNIDGYSPSSVDIIEYFLDIDLKLSERRKEALDLILQTYFSGRRR